MRLDGSQNGLQATDGPLPSPRMRDDVLGATQKSGVPRSARRLASSDPTPAVLAGYQNGLQATDGPLPGLGPAAVPDEPSVSPGTVPTTYDSPPFVFDLEGGRYARLPGVSVGSIMNYASGDMSWYFIDRSEGRVGLHALGADAVWETDDLGRLLPHHVTDPVAWWFGRGGVALALRADRRRLIRYEYSLTQAPRVTGWADVPPGLELASPAENYFQLGPIWVSEDMRGAVAEADGRLTHFDLSRHITLETLLQPLLYSTKKKITSAGSLRQLLNHKRSLTH